MSTGQALFAEKYQVYQSEHVETGYQCTTQRQDIQNYTVLKGFAENKVFAEKAGKNGLESYQSVKRKRINARCSSLV